MERGGKGGPEEVRVGRAGGRGRCYRKCVAIQIAGFRHWWRPRNAFIKLAAAHLNKQESGLISPLFATLQRTDSCTVGAQPFRFGLEPRRHCRKEPRRSQVGRQLLASLGASSYEYLTVQCFHTWMGPHLRD